MEKLEHEDYESAVNWLKRFKEELRDANFNEIGDAEATLDIFDFDWEELDSKESYTDEEDEYDRILEEYNEMLESFRELFQKCEDGELTLEELNEETKLLVCD